MRLLTESDFVEMTWEEYQHYVEQLAEQIKFFLKETKTEIDFILPVIRGGAPLAISLSYLLKAVPFHALQMKHDYKNKEIKILLNSLCLIFDKQKEYVVLVTDGYHASGKTAYLTYDLIKQELPNCKIIYATLGRDIGYPENKRDFFKSFHAFFSNECGVIPKEESNKIGVLTKYTLFPWEILQDELINMNDELIYEG